MNIWENAVITQKGFALQAKLTQGHTLEITKAVTGEGSVSPGLLSQQTAVQTPKQNLKFKAVSYPEEGKCAIPLYLTNDGLTTGYTAVQVGVYAQDPDEGEILYFITQAASGKGVEIPSEAEMPGYNAEWTFYFQYGQADGVSVTVDPANTINAAEAQVLINEALEPVREAIGTAQTTADNAMPKDNGLANEPELRWHLSDGGYVELKRTGTQSAYYLNLVHTSADNKKSYYNIMSSTADGHKFNLATKDDVAIDKKSNFTSFNHYTYECMEFVNLSNITGDKPVASGYCLFINKKADFTSTFSGYLQILISRDGRVFGRQIYGKDGTITQYGAWVEWYDKLVNKTYNTALNVDDLIEDLNDCVLGRAYEFDSSMANTPGSVGGVVNSFGNANQIYQVAYTKETDSRVYMRTNFGSGWSAWSQIGTTSGVLEQPILKWTLSDGGYVELKRTGTQSAYYLNLLHTSADNKKSYYNIMSSTADGHTFNLATNAQGVKADNAMPKSGGTFTSNVKAYESERTDRGLFNEETRTANTAHNGTLQKVKYFINEI